VTQNKSYEGLNPLFPITILLFYVKYNGVYMKKFLSLIIISMCVTSFVSAQNARSTIEQNNRTWERAMMDNDLNTILKMYDEDIISLPSYSPMTRGKSELREHLEKEMGSGNKFTNVEFNTVEVREEGDLAIEIGTYNMSMKMAEGNEWTDTGKYISVWEKKENDWKVIVETWNSDANPWEQMEEVKQRESQEFRESQE
jgi:ketosteroid isomerase-like protein